MSENTTRLILDPDEKEKPSPKRTTDARTALTRGLAQYLAHAVRVVMSGREVSFKYVAENYEEWEKKAKYPAAVVWATEDGVYDKSRLTASVMPSAAVGDNRFVVSHAEVTQNLMLDIWAEDSRQRMALVAAVEDALCPVDWMYGVRLELGHYFNERAEYAPERFSYEDNPQNAQIRYRIAHIGVSARLPKSALFTRPPGKPRAVVTTLEFTDPTPLDEGVVEAFAGGTAAGVTESSD